MACDFVCVINYILSLFLVISFPFYLSVLLVMIVRRKQLKSSFFDLSISIGFADIIYTTHITLYQTYGMVWREMPDSHSVIQSQIFQTGVSAAGWGFYYPQATGVLILAINRLTAIARPTKHKRIWNEKVKMIAIMCQWMMLFPLSVPQFHPCCHSRMDNSSFRPRFVNPHVFNYFWTADIIIEISIALGLIALYSTTAFKMAKYSGQKVGPHNKRSKGLNMADELRLTIIGGVLCVLYLALACCSILTWYYGRYINQYHSVIKLVIQVLFNTSNPFLLIIFSTKMKEQYIKCMTCGKLSAVSAASAT